MTLGIRGGLNQYEFCASNPVNFVDPLGLCGKRTWQDMIREAWNQLISDNKFVSFSVSGGRGLGGTFGITIDQNGIGISIGVGVGIGVSSSFTVGSGISGGDGGQGVNVTGSVDGGTGLVGGGASVTSGLNGASVSGGVGWGVGGGASATVGWSGEVHEFE